MPRDILSNCKVSGLEYERLSYTMVENGKKHRQNSHLINHFPTSEWVEWASERTSERSGGRERSEQSGASERVSGASERANGRASGPVLTSQFLFVPDHSAPPCPRISAFLLVASVKQPPQHHSLFTSKHSPRFLIHLWLVYDNETTAKLFLKLFFIILKGPRDFVSSQMSISFKPYHLQTAILVFTFGLFCRLNLRILRSAPGRHRHQASTFFFASCEQNF